MMKSTIEGKAVQDGRKMSRGLTTALALVAVAMLVGMGFVAVGAGKPVIADPEDGPLVGQLLDPSERVDLQKPERVEIPQETPAPAQLSRVPM
jgi:hypothetical protein